ncbi:MAG: nickel-dependent lactate racemase [Chloroflexi bacterium]|nr:nickel-dependent lactate racemase [Chloroflexota bacterium]
MSRPIKLPYGKQSIEFTLPEENLVGVLGPKPVPPCANPAEEIDRALDNPLDTLPIREIVHPGEKALILVDDYTRATPAAAILPHLLERLQAAGVPREDVTLLVSTGTHRPCSEEELRLKVGPEVYGIYRLEQHDCTDQASQVYLGLTSRATPVWVNRLVVEADRVFGIGHIDPSDYAGYAGGYKLIVPGVASLDTVNANHSLAALSFRQPGRTDLPCRRDLEEAAAMVPADLFLNCVLTQDGQIAHVFAGSPEKIYRVGVEQARKVYEVECPGPVDLVIASGYPYDIDFYQAIRAIEYADAAACAGGRIVLVAPCQDGIGSPEFYRLLAKPGKTPDDFLRDVVRRNGKVTYNILGYYLSRIREEKKLYAFSEGLTGQELEAIGIQPLENLQAGVDRLLGECGPQARVAVLPVGSATIPRIV